MLLMVANVIYMDQKHADKVSLLNTIEKGYVKRVNARSLRIDGVARGTEI